MVDRGGMTDTMQKFFKRTTTALGKAIGEVSQKKKKKKLLCTSEETSFNLHLKHPEGSTNIIL